MARAAGGGVAALKAQGGTLAGNTERLILGDGRP